MRYSKYLVLMIVTVLAFGTAIIFNKTFSNNSSEKEVLKLIDSFYEASSSSNVKQLENLLDDPIKIVTNGYEESLERERYIALLIIQMENVSSIKPSFSTVSISEDEAVVKCFLDIRWNSEDSSSGHRGNYSFLFKKREGIWKIVSIEFKT